MTRISCPGCRLRFSKAATATLTTCPECGQDLEAVDSAKPTLGFRLFVPTDAGPALPMATEAAVPIGVRPDLA